MKKSLFLLVLSPLALGMVLTSCGGNKGNGGGNGGDEVPATYSLMKHWAGNASEEIYTVDESTDQTIIEYKDVVGELAGGWEYVARAFAYDAADIKNFTSYKKFSFTGKLETTSGSDVVMVKVEGTDNNTFEKKFNFSSETSTYEFSTSFITDWSKVTSLLFFVNRSSSETGNGKITLDSFNLSKEAVNADYDIASDMPSVPQDYSIWDGKATSLKVMTTWGYDNTADITTTSESDGTYKFSWGGTKEKTSTYSYVSSRVKATSDADLINSGFKRIHFKLKGTAGEKALLKFQATDNTPNKEKTITLTGEVQEVDVDITSVFAGAEEGVDVDYMAGIFPNPGSQGTVNAGEITLLDCYLDQTEAVVEEDPNINTRSGDSLYINKFSQYDSCYTLTASETANEYTIGFNKSAVGWESLQAAVSGDNLTELTHVSGTFTSDVDTHLIVKPYDSNETKIALTANTPYELDLDIASSTINAEKRFIIMISYESGDSLTGNVKVSNLMMSKPVIDADTNYEADGKINITKFVTDDTSIYSIKGSSVGFNKASGSDWASFRAKLNGSNLSKMNYYSAKVTSTVDVSILFKPMNSGANEKTFTLKAGEEISIEASFTGLSEDKENTFIFFIAPGSGNGEEGTVTFSDFVLESKDLKDPTVNYSENGEVYINNFGTKDNCYTVTSSETANEYTIGFNKTAVGWETLQAVVSGDDLSELTHVTATFTSDVDTHILLKAYDNGANEQNIELKANVATPVEFDIDSTTIDASKKFIIFISMSDGDALSGNVKVSNLKMSKPVVDADTNYEANEKINITKFVTDDTSIYSIDGSSVGFNKASGSDWASFRAKLNGSNLSKMNYYSAKVTSTIDVSILFKPMNNGANEKTFTLKAGEEISIEASFTGLSEGTENTFIFFIAPGSGNGENGTVTFSDFVLESKDYKDPTVNYREGDEIYINNFGTKDNCYTVTASETANEYTIGFSKSAVGWETLQATVSGDNLTELTKVSATFTSDVDTHILLKAYDNGANEKNFELKAGVATPVEFTIDSTTIDSSKKFIIFISMSDGDALSGNVKVSSLKLSK